MEVHSRLYFGTISGYIWLPLLHLIIGLVLKYLFEHISNELRGGLLESDDDLSVILLHYGDHSSALLGQSKSGLVVVRLRSSNSANFAQRILLLARPANESRGDHSRTTEHATPVSIGLWRLGVSRASHHWQAPLSQMAIWRIVREYYVACLPTVSHGFQQPNIAS